jgi:hypothetical protein
MKKLVLLATAGIAMSGCWKEKEDVDTFTTLTGTRWVIASHVAYGPVSPGDKCDVADSLVFMTDSTGYYIYPKPCDSGDASKVTFKFELSYDKRNLYCREIGGLERQGAAIGISEYRYNELRLRGGWFGKRRLDGYFNGVKDSL